MEIGQLISYEDNNWNIICCLLHVCATYFLWCTYWPYLFLILAIWHNFHNIARNIWYNENLYYCIRVVR